MKRFIIGVSGVALLALPFVVANRPPFNSKAIQMSDNTHKGQAPLNPAAPDNLDQPVRTAVPLSDILGSNRALTTFSSLARMHASTETLLGSFAVNTTVLAPLNSAMDSLPRKPWEDSQELEEHGAHIYEGDDGKERADKNLRRFVEAHLVTTSPWKANDKVKTVLGREVWWEEKDGKRVIMPDGVEVDRVANQVANGEIWILKGVLKSASK
ncbi:hypothetical protein VHEMI03694 [[Torrubiella] hemipterigena]|uniref:FAS1 domain-containing protein n=1 Tax=[Torrubiella] hemipterigena TaxID=1531966 RepID=A0A0A1STB8_9HYPO|nr:hypothetical protein VHEMI03694 [[Torrubiella] hemipterigena]